MAADQPAMTPRRRDAQATRRALLEAGIEAFRSVGYQQASTRAIGERAGVDAALIKRYFGGKEGLYLAALEEMAPPASLPARGLARRIIEISEVRGSNPVGRALYTADPDDARRAAVARVIERFLVGPLVTELEADAGARAEDRRLRAELAVAMIHGTLLARESGLLPLLAETSGDELATLLDPLVDALLEE